MGYGRSTWGRPALGRLPYGRCPRGDRETSFDMIPAVIRPFATHYFEFRNSEYLTLEPGVAVCYDPISGLSLTATGSEQPAWDAVNYCQFDTVNNALRLPEPLILPPNYSVFTLIKRSHEQNMPIGYNTPNFSLWGGNGLIRHRADGVDDLVGGVLSIDSWKGEAICVDSEVTGFYQSVQIGIDTSPSGNNFSVYSIPASISSINSGFSLAVMIVCAQKSFTQADVESALATLEASI